MRALDVTAYVTSLETSLTSQAVSPWHRLHPDDGICHTEIFRLIELSFQEDGEGRKSILFNLYMGIGPYTDFA